MDLSWEQWKRTGEYWATWTEYTSSRGWWGVFFFAIDLLKSAGACFHKGYCCEDQICPHLAGECILSIKSSCIYKKTKLNKRQPGCMLGQLSFPRTHFFLVRVFTEDSWKRCSIYPCPNTSTSASSARGSMSHVTNAFKCLSRDLNFGWTASTRGLHALQGQRFILYSGFPLCSIHQSHPSLTLLLSVTKKICSKWQIAPPSTGNTHRGGYLSLRDYADRNFSRQIEIRISFK